MGRALGIGGFVFASFAAGCGAGSLTDARGGPPPSMPQVQFQTLDRSTGINVATVRIYKPFSAEIPSDVVDTVVSRIRVATWPGDIAVPTVETRLSFPSIPLPDGGEMSGYVEIDEQLDPSLDARAWYAISLPAPTAAYTMPANPFFLDLDGGATGSRFSPAHAPVVTSITACAKDRGVVEVYAGYSEPIVKAAGVVPSVDYGAKPIVCTVGDDSATSTQFNCPNAGSETQPLSLRIPDGMAAQASGAAMASATLDSNGMQTGSTGNACSIYKPLTPD